MIGSHCRIHWSQWVRNLSQKLTPAWIIIPLQEMTHILIGKTPQEALSYGYVVNDFTSGQWSSTKTNVELRYGVIVKVWPSFFRQENSFISTFFGFQIQKQVPEPHRDQCQDDAESWVSQRLQT